jgi:hypothetical protein
MTAPYSLSRLILREVERLPEGEPITAKRLLHLGARAAVDQALTRLARRGALTRLSRGFYIQPVKTRFGERAPEIGKTVQALARALGETVVTHGAVAANNLGLSTQVPIRPVYLTSGPNRRLTLGGQVVEFRHAPAWQLAEPQSRAGEVLRALCWAGPEQAHALARTLRERLPQAERETLADLRTGMPGWMATCVSAAMLPRG